MQAIPEPLAPPGATPTAATEFIVTGMTCANCVRHAGAAVQAVPGVAGTPLWLAAGRLRVRWTGAAANTPGVLAALAQAGFAGREVAPDAVAGTTAQAVEPGKPAPARQTWQWPLLAGLLALAPLMAGEWFLGLGMTPWFRWVEFALALAVQGGGGVPFYTGAWRQLRHGRSNMDTLVALGSGTAFTFSLYILTAETHEHLYFLDATAIITLVSLGHWLEARTSAGAEIALRQLLQLAPPRARRQDAAGTETEVAAADLQLREIFRLRPGDRVPTDGVVLAGEGNLEEAMLTGEARPVAKRAGDRVYGGTVNLDGRLEVRVTATGEATALAQIIAAVARAQGSRADIQRLADRVSAVFVPVVVLLAVGAGLWWGLAPAAARDLAAHLGPLGGRAGMAPADGWAGAVLHVAAVLVIACPCAMGLATPAAIMAAANAAARRGILIRDGVALEKAGRINTVVFDKTGTLTTGRARVTGTWWPGLGPAAVTAAERLAAALARPSQHPYSQAVAGLTAAETPLREWREVAGAGVQAKVFWPGARPGAVARLGSPRWLTECGVSLPPEGAPGAGTAATGGSWLGLAVETQWLGWLLIGEEPKPEAAGVVAMLEAQGLQVHLLTGDQAGPAAEVARLLGLPAARVRAGVRPAEKAVFLQDLRAQGRRVAFVGDGINDAPALAAADLGIAVSRASDVARAAADIVLLQADLAAVPEAIGLARAALRTMRQNLFWAFFYNVLALPLAALGQLSPLLCAAAMGMSDLVVIGNALRLLGWRPPGPPRPLPTTAAPMPTTAK